MPKAESITRAPESEFSDILIKRDGEADLMLEKGRLLLTVETKPAGLIANAMTQRWKIYRLYGGKPPLIKDRFGKTPPFRTLVVNYALFRPRMWRSRRSVGSDGQT